VQRQHIQSIWSYDEKKKRICYEARLIGHLQVLDSISDMKGLLSKKRGQRDTYCEKKKLFCRFQDMRGFGINLVFKISNWSIWGILSLRSQISLTHYFLPQKQQQNINLLLIILKTKVIIMSIWSCISRLCEAFN